MFVDMKADKLFRGDTLPLYNNVTQDISTMDRQQISLYLHEKHKVLK